MVGADPAKERQDHQQAEAMYATKDSLPTSAAEPRFSSKGEQPIAKSPYVRKYYDDDGEYPIPPRSELGKRIPSSKRQ